MLQQAVACRHTCQAVRQDRIAAEHCTWSTSSKAGNDCLVGPAAAAWSNILRHSICISSSCQHSSASVLLPLRSRPCGHLLALAVLLLLPHELALLQQLLLPVAHS
jgi:hypothetical protein